MHGEVEKEISGVVVERGFLQLAATLGERLPHLCVQTSVILLVKAPESGPGAQSSEFQGSSGLEGAGRHLLRGTREQECGPGPSGGEAPLREPLATVGTPKKAPRAQARPHGKHIPCCWCRGDDFPFGTGFSMLFRSQLETSQCHYLSKEERNQHHHPLGRL